MEFFSSRNQDLTTVWVQSESVDCFEPQYSKSAIRGTAFKKFKVDDYSHFFLFFFLRDENSQHFNEDLLAVNASSFSFVLCFKASNYAGASNYVLSAN